MRYILRFFILKKVESLFIPLYICVILISGVQRLAAQTGRFPLEKHFVGLKRTAGSFKGKGRMAFSKKMSG